MLAKLSVGDYMTSNPVFFKPTTNVMDAIHKLLEIKSTGAPVLDDAGKLVGAFSELDCLRITVHAAYHEDMGGKVAEFMTQDVTVVKKETSILEVAELFTKSLLRHFPVIENGKLVGVISRVDVLKALLSA